MENKLEIGEFIRTKGGRIGKIVDYTVQIGIDVVDGEIVETPEAAYLMDTYYSFDDEPDVWTEDMIKSHGKRLVDIIEHGDLVNMLLVLQVTKVLHLPDFDKLVQVIDGNNTISLSEDDIRHVVCREILERDGYKRKEE